MRIYLDSVIVVYFLDHVGEFQVRAANRMAALKSAGDQIVVSELVRMECRVDPIRKNDHGRLTGMDGFFSLTDVEFVPITTAVFERATRNRAVHRYKAIDSLNLAAAVEGRCDVFLTNDRQLRGFLDVAVEILP